MSDICMILIILGVDVLFLSSYYFIRMHDLKKEEEEYERKNNRDN